MGADAFQYLSLTLDVFLVDLLLSGDNAVVIALACRSLPAPQKRQGMLFGAGAAIALRILLALIASAFLRIPLLRLIGGLALVAIAIQLIVDEPPGGAAQGGAGSRGPTTSISSAVRTIVIADVVMSADNVIAVAAVAQGNVTVLVLGLLISVPFLMGGSWYVSSLLVRFPWLVPLGGALLGWFAGDIASSDVLYADWIEHQAPALRLAVPALCALYVLLQARIMADARPAARAMRPARETRQPPAAPVPVIASGSAGSAVVAASADPAGARFAPAGDDAIASAVPAGPEPTPRASAAVATAPAPFRPRRSTLLRWALGAAGFAGAIGLGSVAWTTRWLPSPGKLARYECSNGAFLYYRPGGQRIAVSRGDSVVNGVILYNNVIDWGNYHQASMKLGTVPPTRVLFGNAQTLQVEGGLFNDVTCRAR
jgi:YjbE family integral membrane protein